MTSYRLCPNCTVMVTADKCPFCFFDFIPGAATRSSPDDAGLSRPACPTDGTAAFYPSAEPEYALGDVPLGLSAFGGENKGGRDKTVEVSK